MCKKSILVASFGTSYEETLEKTIAKVEENLAMEFPSFKIKRAFTSTMIVKNLRDRGIIINKVDEALNELLEEGVEEVYVVPTHVIAGEEYEKLISMAEAFRGKFATIKIGKPLIYTTEDMEKAVDSIAKNITVGKDTALVLMGHGTEHYVNTVYSAMDYMFKEKGFNNIFMGTVEAYPGLKTVIGLVKKAGYKKAVLSPFMLVAGDHANNDMAGEKNSWKSEFINNGIDTKTIIKGIGEYKEIRQMYVEHTKKYLEI